MGDALVGTWKLVENNTEDFNKYMEKVGVSFLIRQAACHLKPDVSINKDGEDWCVKTMSTFKNTELKFKCGEEFDETTADGRKVKSTITLENGALVQKQAWDGKQSTITREVKDGRMVTTCIFNDVNCIRIYDRK
ncbi:fatty acid-binding protein, adipocyte-like [Anomaloglossus baeobatrachus]|uniref:fatty acid-binding protein, adipocyte-like n=1 Tax=Anomaloglossus baeobatrachus TaxID=238106 RepID=UPI003F500B01